MHWLYMHYILHSHDEPGSSHSSLWSYAHVLILSVISRTVIPIHLFVIYCMLYYSPILFFRSFLIVLIIEIIISTLEIVNIFFYFFYYSVLKTCLMNSVSLYKLLKVHTYMYIHVYYSWLQYHCIIRWIAINYKHSIFKLIQNLIMTNFVYFFLFFCRRRSRELSVDSKAYPGHSS